MEMVLKVLIWFGSAQLEMALIPLVADIRVRGIKIDRPRLEQILSTHEANKKQLATELRGELRSPKLNFASPKQLLVALKADGFGNRGHQQGNPFRHRKSYCRPNSAIPPARRSVHRQCGVGSKALTPTTGFIRRSILWERKLGDFLAKRQICSATPRNSEIRGCIIADDGFVLIEPDLCEYRNADRRVVCPGKANARSVSQRRRHSRRDRRAGPG